MPKSSSPPATGLVWKPADTDIGPLAKTKLPEMASFSLGFVVADAHTEAAVNQAVDGELGLGTADEKGCAGDCEKTAFHGNSLLREPLAEANDREHRQNVDNVTITG